jgi:hypothetical protein
MNYETEIVMADPGQVEKVQALFAESLRRYKEQSDKLDRGWTPQKIVFMSLRTLQQNGFTLREIKAAMLETR